MFDNIRSMEAFKQKTDFCGGDIPYIVKCGTDIDFVYRLANNKMLAVESKKDTLKHSVSNIITSSQWQEYRDSLKSTTYLVYATHNKEIKENEDIPIEALTARYVEVEEQEIIIPENLNLSCLINYFGSLDTYYIKVKYPNNVVEYALKHPINKKWSCNKYWSEYVSFIREEYAYEYIKSRYKKDFNRSYIYEIWYINEDGDHNKVIETDYNKGSILI